jgi:ubiquinone/menaquinone biosynthesis C-methylase UbiE
MQKGNFLKRYLSEAPIFLAMERAIECRLISEIELKRPILDLGCGDGIFSSILFSEPSELGIDISLNELMKASKKRTYRNIAAGDLSILPLKARSFNTIICNSVMEHVINLEEALKEACRVLSPGGKFILALPTENYDKFLFYPRILQGLGLKDAAKRYRKAVNKTFRHYHAYAPARWVRIIEDNGFKVTKTVHFCPEKVMTLSDFCLPFNSISLLNKKIFKRWVMCPFLRKYIAGYLELFLRKAYLCNDSNKGACILIEATPI